MSCYTDVKNVCLLGSGPILIGQACEFDYSGVQGILALQEENIRVVLVNSNPATIMTDSTLADATYIEPLTMEVVANILEKERCDAILATLGGQTALNLVMELHKAGVLERLNITLLGASIKSIQVAEDRQLFKEAMKSVGLPVLPSVIIKSDKDWETDTINFPLILRPSYTLGGTGTSIVYNKAEYIQGLKIALEASPIKEVLVERSVVGWKEFELEVMRDRADTVVVVCSIENIDGMGVHTGDSITVAPALTLTDKEYQILRNASATCLRKIGIETGGANVQFAVHPSTGEWVIIEMNPRVSRSSALASKATGFPIARLATKLALGYRLDELTNTITERTPASFEPALDYVVVKIPRFTFEKFSDTDDVLGTSMKSVGEVMAIGKCFEEAFLKAIRSLDIHEKGLTSSSSITKLDNDALINNLRIPNSKRIWVITEAIRRGFDTEIISYYTKWDPWFIDRLKTLVTMDINVLSEGTIDPNLLLPLKRLGFSDDSLNILREDRKKSGCLKQYRKIDTCAGEFFAATPYLYGSYSATLNEVPEKNRDSVIILGSGPIRIGQGIEFDSCCVQAIEGIKKSGKEAIMINCNPETVSTDWDMVDRLYLEPLTLEDILDIIDQEKPYGVIVQFGGQTPLKLSYKLSKEGINILGTPSKYIDIAEDRDKFSILVNKLNLREPVGSTVTSLEEALRLSRVMGFPLLMRPSYILGGRGIRTVYTEEDLETYWEKRTTDYPVLINRFLERAIEVDVDALSDGKDTVICGILEHIEEAGIHSGDSACTFPSMSLSTKILTEIKAATILLAKELKVVGLLNIQFAVRDELVYILEANPRASRTVPFTSKATGVPWATLAAQLCCGTSLASLNIHDGAPFGVSVKMPVFPFDRFPNVDPILGPEMLSTGEVMGIAGNFGEAYAKAAIAAGLKLPQHGAVFLSISDMDKPRIIPLAEYLIKLGFTILATNGTAKFLKANSIESEVVYKVSEFRPNAIDLMINGRIQLIVNTITGSSAHHDGMNIRKGAIEYHIPYITTIEGALAATKAITVLQNKKLTQYSLQEWRTQTVG